MTTKRLKTFDKMKTFPLHAPKLEWSFLLFCRTAKAQDSKEEREKEKERLLDITSLNLTLICLSDAHFTIAK